MWLINTISLCVSFLNPCEPKCVCCAVHPPRRNHQWNCLSFIAHLNQNTDNNYWKAVGLGAGVEGHFFMWLAAFLFSRLASLCFPLSCMHDKCTFLVNCIVTITQWNQQYTRKTEHTWQSPSFASAVISEWFQNELVTIISARKFGIISQWNFFFEKALRNKCWHASFYVCSEWPLYVSTEFKHLMKLPLSSGTKEGKVMHMHSTYC